ncbi:MAG: AAA family ATPase [Bacilli bacterium]|jgi:predicted ATPase
MELVGIKVRNFKVLRDVLVGLSWEDTQDIPLRKTTVLIGKNGTGKSTLIESIKLISDIYKFGITKAIDIHGGSKFLRHIDSPHKEIQITLYFRGGIDEHYSYQVSVGEDTNGKPIISGEILKMHGWFIKDVYIGNSSENLMNGVSDNLTVLLTLKDILSNIKFIDCIDKRFDFEEVSSYKNASLVCIEHPETGIYWGTLLNLISDLNTVDLTATVNTQFVVTTHSPAILSSAEPHDVWMFRSMTDNDYLTGENIKVRNVNVEYVREMFKSGAAEGEQNVLGCLWMEGVFDSVVFDDN